MDTTERLKRYCGPYKLSLVEMVSDPKKVLQNAVTFGYNPDEIFISDRMGKKYMLIHTNKKPIHFGSLFYEDYTFTHDQKKRENFRKRNRAWYYGSKYSAGKLSYVLLW